MVELYEDERLDYLFAEGELKIIQSPSVFSFSLDAMLLANFTYVPIQKGNILDLCTGNGVIPLLLTKRTKAKITGVEIQERLVDMAKRSIQYNDLEQQITIIHQDLRKLNETLPQSQFDVITCNPPYFETERENEKNVNKYIRFARHEILCTLEDVIKACKLFVRPRGKVAIVHRPERLTDLFILMRNYRIEPKRLQLIYPKRGKEANMMLIEGIRDGKKGLKLLPPFYIYEQNGTYTEEAKRVFYGCE